MAQTSTRTGTHLRLRTLIAAVALVGGAVAVTVLYVVTHQTSEEVAFASADVEVVSADLDAGYVTVTAEDRDDVVVTVIERSGNLVHPSREVTLEDGVLVLRGHCEGAGIGTCEVSFRVAVPRDAAVDLRAATTAGNVTTRGLRGAVAATTLGGDVVLQGHEGGRVEVTTADGAVRLVAVEAPGQVDVSTDSGNVLLRLPDVGYRIDATTGTGSEQVRLAADVATDREVVVRSTSGNVALLEP